MASDPKLRLPTSPRVALFRACDRIIRADPVLRGVGLKVFSWEGKAHDKDVLALGEAPVLRMTPRSGPETWWTPDTMRGTLQVDCELGVKSLCSDDIDNLWHAIERAFYPEDTTRRQQISRQLTQEYFAHTGLPRFAQPAYDPNGGEDGQFSASGQFQVDFRLPLTT